MMEPGRHLWLVLQVEPFHEWPAAEQGVWRSLVGPSHYLPVFGSREEAESYARGRYEIREIVTTPPLELPS